MIWTDQQGGERKYTFWDLMSLSNAAANILLNYGIHKGDRVMLMLHRVPEWWILTIALTKLGAVVSPSPTMLTAKDIRYRVDLAQFKMVITDMENAPKVDEVYSECASLMSRLVVDGERDGWISLPQEMTYPAPVSHKIVKHPGDGPHAGDRPDDHLLHLGHDRRAEDGAARPVATRSATW